MSAPQKIAPLERLSPYWADRLAALIANADLLTQCGLSVGKLLQRFTNPPPHYGDPVLATRGDRAGVVTRIGGPTDAEKRQAELSDRAYREARNRLAEHYRV